MTRRLKPFYDHPQRPCHEPRLRLGRWHPIKMSLLSTQSSLQVWDGRNQELLQELALILLIHARCPLSLLMPRCMMGAEVLWLYSDSGQWPKELVQQRDPQWGITVECNLWHLTISDPPVKIYISSFAPTDFSLCSGCSLAFLFSFLLCKHWTPPFSNNTIIYLESSSLSLPLFSMLKLNLKEKILNKDSYQWEILNC